MKKILVIMDKDLSANINPIYDVLVKEKDLHVDKYNELESPPIALSSFYSYFNFILNTTIQKKINFIHLLNEYDYVFSDQLIFRFFPESIVNMLTTTYIDTWHGTQIKAQNDIWKIMLVDDYYIFSQSVWQTEYYSSKHGIDLKRILKFGYPRITNQIFTSPDENKQNKEKILKKYNLENFEKINLYAPTFLPEKKQISLRKVRKEMNIEANELLIVKFHNISKGVKNGPIIRWNLINKKNNVSFLKLEGMTQEELFTITDHLFTDYSSIAVDFVSVKNDISAATLLRFNKLHKNYKRKNPIFHLTKDILDYQVNSKEKAFDKILNWVKNHEK